MPRRLATVSALPLLLVLLSPIAAWSEDPPPSETTPVAGDAEASGSADESATPPQELGVLAETCLPVG